MFEILVVTNGWGVRTIGGGEYHILRVLQRWSKDHKIAIIIPRSGYVSSGEMLSKDYPVYLSSCEKKVSNVTTEATFYLMRMLRSSLFKFKHNPDMIISSSHLIYDVLPALFLRTRFKSKLVVYVHGFFLRSNDKGIWRIIATWSEKISFFLCKKADLIFVVNPEIKDALIARGFQADKIVMTSNGVERDFIDSVKVNEKIFDACFCGRLVEKKGVYDLIYIWERILKSFPRSRLVIIGDGPEYDNISRIVKNKALDKNIIFTGFISEEQKRATIKSSRIFVSPSYEESWGIAVSEAMACGLAVVCYNLSAYKIFGDGIIKIGIGDKEGMAKAIASLIEDKNLQEAFVATAKKTITDLSDWENISSKELKEINQVLNR